MENALIKFIPNLASRIFGHGSSRYFLQSGVLFDGLFHAKFLIFGIPDGHNVLPASPAVVETGQMSRDRLIGKRCYNFIAINQKITIKRAITSIQPR